MTCAQLHWVRRKQITDNVDDLMMGGLNPSSIWSHGNITAPAHQTQVVQNVPFDASIGNSQMNADSNGDMVLTNLEAVPFTSVTNNVTDSAALASHKM